MIDFFKKLLKFGAKRLYLLIVVRVICRIKSLYWRWLLSDNKPLLINAKIFQPTQFVGKGEIKIGASQIGVWPSPGILNSICYLEARTSDSSINIGDGTFINNGAVIIADKTQIKIGDRCLIGPGFFVCDSDFHGLAIKNRSNGNYDCRSVNIGSDVFIGDGVKVMKGVTIGDGAVIGSGSVVVKNVVSNTIHAGSPAKYIKDIPLS